MGEQIEECNRIVASMPLKQTQHCRGMGPHGSRDMRCHKRGDCMPDDRRGRGLSKR